MLRDWFTRGRKGDRFVIHNKDRTFVAVTVHKVGDGEVKLEFDVQDGLRLTVVRSGEEKQTA